jgi:hypothetical protein
MRADLSLQQAPPFSVPARFLLSAPLFGLLAALVLLWHGPGVFSHRWTPEILAVTHFLTLGFLTMSMLGAMLQLMPVLMGMVIPHPTLFSSIVHIPLFLGSLSLGLAWLLQIKMLFIIAMLLLGLSFSIFIAVAMDRLLRSASKHVTRSMMLMALLALFITASLGLYLAAAYAWQPFPLARNLTDLHLTWGLTGWVLLLIIAVAYQVIPMFQITDNYPVLHQRWVGRFIFASLLGISLYYFVPMPFIKPVFVTLLGCCIILFSLTTLWLLHKRRRQLPDTTLNFWRLAMVSLTLLALVGTLSTLLNFNLPILLLGILMVYGFAMTTINGMMYKIFPFIIWLHLSARNKFLRDRGGRSSQIKVPHVRKIIPEKAGLTQFRLHLITLVLLVLASVWPQWFFYPAALLFAVEQAFLLINLLKAAHLYKTKYAELLGVTQNPVEPV